MAAVNVRKRVEICSQDLAETIYIAYIYSFREREKKKQNKKKNSSESIGAGLIVLILFRYTDIGMAKREDASRCLELHLFKVQRGIPKDVGPDQAQVWPDP